MGRTEKRAPKVDYAAEAAAISAELATIDAERETMIQAVADGTADRTELTALSTRKQELEAQLRDVLDIQARQRKLAIVEDARAELQEYLDTVDAFRAAIPECVAALVEFDTGAEMIAAAVNKLLSACNTQDVCRGIGDEDGDRSRNAHVFAAANRLSTEHLMAKLRPRLETAIGGGSAPSVAPAIQADAERFADMAQKVIPRRVADVLNPEPPRDPQALPPGYLAR